MLPNCLRFRWRITDKMFIYIANIYILFSLHKQTSCQSRIAQRVQRVAALTHCAWDSIVLCCLYLNVCIFVCMCVCVKSINDVWFYVFVNMLKSSPGSEQRMTTHLDANRKTLLPVDKMSCEWKNGKYQHDNSNKNNAKYTSKMCILCVWRTAQVYGNSELSTRRPNV